MALISVNCGILSAVSGLQLPCNPATSTYTQQVVITYENNPTLGVLVVQRHISYDRHESPNGDARKSTRRRSSPLMSTCIFHI